MGTKCAPLLADIFQYSYVAEFIQSLLPVGKKRLASQFNFTYRYIDDVLSIYNPGFENYLCQMYPPELRIKDTTESNTSASYFDLLLSIGTVNFALPEYFPLLIHIYLFCALMYPLKIAYAIFIKVPWTFNCKILSVQMFFLNS